MRGALLLGLLLAGCGGEVSAERECELDASSKPLPWCSDSPGAAICCICGDDGCFVQETFKDDFREDSGSSSSR